jgi:L-histidine Nalpha-methyltransferase
MSDYAISHLAAEETGDELAREVMHALSARPRRLSPKWLYDARGSQLFDAITRQPEYYPTRTELSILEGQGEAIAEWVGSGPVTVEYGAGSGEKARRLLSAIDSPSAYVCVEIEANAAEATAAAVAAGVPGLPVEARVGDFTALEADVPPLPSGPRLGFFPGSTLGNFDPGEARDLLSRFHRHLGSGARLLVGLDRKKPVEHLLPAYDDAAGVTAAFNLNLLARINRELEADFDLEGFEHEARWNPQHERMEMHLVSRARQQVRVRGQAFDFDEGESLHTECSYKYSDERVEALLDGSGWRQTRRFTDPRGFFMVLGLEAA